MLCQTQVSRVITYYNDWLRKFPTVEILAQATTSDVLSAWSGLGYNSRGLRVLQSAKDIVARWSFPTTYVDLVTLPGVGDYVASAILAFAYGQNVAVIDTNIRRILIHQFSLDEKISLQELKEIALKVLPHWYATEWYNALMDYGALELTAKKSGIRPLTRQSKFEGSRRQVRAWIVKQLVMNNEEWKMKNEKRVIATKEAIHNWITRWDIEKRFPDRDDIQSIVDDLVKEKIIVVEDWRLKIYH